MKVPDGANAFIYNDNFYFQKIRMLILALMVGCLMVRIVKFFRCLQDIPED